MVDYEGIFFDDEEVKKIQKYESHRLKNIHEKIHCTFVYRPSNDELYDELLNKEIDVYLISYGYSKNNSGFEIEIDSKYMKYYNNLDSNNNIKKPHITASISDNGKSKNTDKLNFVPLEKKVKIKGKFGYWVIYDNNEYVSFEPHRK